MKRHRKQRKPSDGPLLRGLVQSPLVATRRQARVLLLLFSFVCLTLSALNLAETYGFFEPPVYREDISQAMLEQIPPEKRAQIPSRRDNTGFFVFIRQAFARQ